MTDIETFVSAPTDAGQFLLQVYTDDPVLRTVAWRPHPGATWGAPHVLNADPAASTAADLMKEATA